MTSPARRSAHRLETIHPDDFLLDQLDLSPPTVLRVTQEQAAHTRQPRNTRSRRELLDRTLTWNQAICGESCASTRLTTISTGLTGRWTALRR
jgi:hypothetical protein